ncbi:nucleotide-binding protein [Marinomonas sp. THO17]|uniref:nucleotide-binding protein n=1 Tax=Marinomonas sp. THO17 TaxID=3149048 RepID=UPI00336BD5E3
MELDNIDKSHIERYFDMQSGYVLHYSNRTFEDLFHSFGISIYDEMYSDLGTSKAKRLRSFIQKNHHDLVKAVLLKMVEEYDSHSTFQYMSSDDKVKIAENRSKCIQAINNIGTISHHISSPTNITPPILITESNTHTHHSTKFQSSKGGNMPDQTTPHTFQSVQKHKVFIVHGHDEHLLLEVENLCRKLNLEPIVLKDQSSGGATIIEKLEKHSDVTYAIVLYTECDEGRRVGTETVRKRARQNVIFEHGYFIGTLGRDKVSSIIKGDIEIQGDVSGVVYIMHSQDWKYQIAREMKDSGLTIDLNYL